MKNIFNMIHELVHAIVHYTIEVLLVPLEIIYAALGKLIEKANYLKG